jgi:hypothetical protein
MFWRTALVKYRRLLAFCDRIASATLFLVSRSELAVSFGIRWITADCFLVTRDGVGNISFLQKQIARVDGECGTLAIDRDAG